MNLPRPTRTTVILSLCLAVLAGMLGYEHHQLSTLSNGLAATADKDSLDAMLARLGKVDERLDTVDGKHLVTNEDFRSGQQALSNRIDAVQAYAKQATESVHELSRDAASSGELMVLKANVETVENRLHELSQAQIKQPPAVAPRPKPVVRKPPPAPKPSSSAVTSQTPPFTIVGIEYRGGERFLSVAPPGSTQLNQIYLIRPGDAVAGTAWRLNALDGKSARFEVAGTPQTITVAQ
ncbi:MULTISPECIES: methyl-accepting chemotaxis protein [Pseudomonas]|uniref:Methyl-accepting chemotaxis protein n=1 Tax=Pseudomonas gessardii TaxID=78544 RepID=A0A7Y1MW42_9PSED|nr:MULTISPECIES: methyl-accepting chemotaxis protein [Pseudomonas]NNA99296.1 methyl-accepting chemotaxis protein [Pseudomonas gessardii]OPK00785.1 methyl-accepting chemotaxis protein [Pseudomonas veronii]QIH10337.1 methyl-accepting chemotaxis protein [Pseudomonas sp. BIOMIG1BAC]